MPRVQANGIEIDYAESGRASDPALILIRGLGTQRIQWPERFVASLAERGLRVIAPDNRDVGDSQKLTGAGTPDVLAAMTAIAAGDAADIAYRISDMAMDVVGLMDVLEVELAHVMGISMGGMIVQHLAASHGTRVASMTSVMSTSGAPGLPPATPEAMAALMSQPDDPSSRDSVIANAIQTQRVIGSPGYPTSDDELRAMAGRAYDRCYCPDGVSRQLIAVTADTQRHELLAQIGLPVLVIHGEDDPLIRVECGRDTADRIEGAKFETIPGMGHDIPAELVDTLVERLSDHIKRASG